MFWLRASAGLLVKEPGWKPLSAKVAVSFFSSDNAASCSTSGLGYAGLVRKQSYMARRPDEDR